MQSGTETTNEVKPCKNDGRRAAFEIVMDARLRRAPAKKETQGWKLNAKDERQQQEQVKVKKTQQKPSVDGGHEERGLHIRLSLFVVNNGRDEWGRTKSLCLSPAMITTS